MWPRGAPWATPPRSPTPPWSTRSAAGRRSRPRRTEPVSVAEPGAGEVWTWRQGPLAPGPAVLVDIDGVVADAGHRLHLVERRPRDWDAFFAAAADDPPL